MTASLPSSRPFLARLFLSPAEARLRAGWRLLGHLGLLVFTFGACGIALGAFILSAAGPETLNQGSLSLYLAASFASGLAITISVYLARRLFDRRSFASLGLQVDRRAGQELLFGVGLAGAMQGLIFLLTWAAGWMVVTGFSWQELLSANDRQPFLQALMLFVFVGWQEELLMRGYWLKNLSEGLNTAWGVALSSALFALGHLANPGFSPGALVGLALAGAFFAFACLQTGRLWLPIGLHIGWNIFEGPVFGFPVSGLGLSPLVEQITSGPALLTGGAFGPEAGLVLLPALLFGAVVIYLVFNRVNLRT
jgi:membrane protease YdiL (CAAX protease family)